MRKERYHSPGHLGLRPQLFVLLFDCILCKHSLHASKHAGVVRGCWDEGLGEGNQILSAVKINSEGGMQGHTIAGFVCIGTDPWERKLIPGSMPWVHISSPSVFDWPMFCMAM